MYFSLIFIYGWPFDDTFVISTIDNKNNYELVDKTPPLWLFNIHIKPWHTNGVKQWLIIYKITTCIVIIITIYNLIGERLVLIFKQLFCTIDNVVGAATRYIYNYIFYLKYDNIKNIFILIYFYIPCDYNKYRIPYSVVDGIDTYCPIVSLDNSVHQADHTLIFADIEKANFNHLRPSIHAIHLSHFLATQEHNVDKSTFVNKSHDIPINLYNLSLLLPKSAWKTCLGTVEYYPSNDELFDIDNNNNNKYLKNIHNATESITIEIELKDIDGDIVNINKNETKNEKKSRIYVTSTSSIQNINTTNKNININDNNNNKKPSNSLLQVIIYNNLIIYFVIVCIINNKLYLIFINYS